MGRNVFVSFRFADGNDYKEQICEVLKKKSTSYDFSESFSTLSRQGLNVGLLGSLSKATKLVSAQKYIVTSVESLITTFSH